MIIMIVLAVLRWATLLFWLGIGAAQKGGGSSPPSDGIG